MQTTLKTTQCITCICDEINPGSLDYHNIGLIAHTSKELKHMQALHD